MKKGYLFLAAGVVAAVALIAISTASAHRYQGKYGHRHYTVAAEKSRSMMDCMDYAANFKSRGRSGDKADLNRQFGSMMYQTNRVYTYNYDKYTNVILDCSRGRCICRCMPKD